jgi:hypothetical protein
VLACGLRWHHRLAPAATETTIVLADGRTIRHDRLNGVLNRLAFVPALAFARVSADDREYAAEEVLALWASWLHSLPCVVMNRPSGQVVSPWRARSEWVWRASRAGLTIVPYRESSADGTSDEAMTASVARNAASRTVFVVGDRVVPADVPEPVRNGCLRLARDAQVSLLSAAFQPDPVGGWAFLCADPFPDLRLGGGALLNALAAELDASRL